MSLRTLVFYFALLSAVFIVTASKVAQVTTTPDCLNEVRAIIRQIQFKHFEVLVPHVMYSGKGLNDLGSQLLCNQMANNSGHYKVIKFYAMGNNFSIGLCGPGHCTLKDYEEFAPKAQDMLDFLVNKTTNQTLHTEIRFIDPDILPTKFGAASYISVFMIVFYVLCAAIGTTFDYLDQPNTNPTSTFATAAASGLNATIPSGSTNGNGRLNGHVASIDKESTLEALLANREVPVVKRDGAAKKFFKCFSLIGNFDKLVSDRDGGDANLEILNGIRTISIIWIIWGHGYDNRGGISQNVNDITPTVTEPFALFVLTAVYAVDVFFFIGGFLLAFILAKKLEKDNFSGKYYIATVIHRYLRLMPTYAFVLFFWWGLVQYIGSGPLWHVTVERTHWCDSMGWSNVLLIDNYFGGFSTAYCFAHGWYMSNDFQIFLIAPFLIALYKTKPLGAKAAIWGIILAACAYTFWLSNHYSFVVAVPVPGQKHDSLADYYDKYYYKPWTRSPPYLFGIFYGLFYREISSFFKSKAEVPQTVSEKIGVLVKKNMMVRWALYVVGFFMMYGTVAICNSLLKDPNSWSQFENDVYITIGKFIFVLGLSMMLLGWILDETSYVRQFLTMKVFNILGKLSFCAYLLHPTIINLVVFVSKAGYYFSHGNCFLSLISDVIITNIFSMIIYVLVEMSMANVETLFLFPRKARAEPQPNQHRKVEA